MTELLSTQEETKRRKKLFYDYQHSEDYRERIVQRLQINDACANDIKAQAVTWSLCARPDNPAEGCIFFIENFGWTFDPRPQAAPHHLPMLLFDYQKEAIRWIIDHIDKGSDGLFEKSRDMGASVLLFVFIPLWYWLFRDGSNFLVGSYKQDLVDNRTRDSIFGMYDYTLDGLPSWLLPKGFNMNKHRTQMKLINPANNNQITGDTMNPNFGRGSRKTAVLFDELGFWDYAKDAWESTGDVTACRIANSTPSGYNYFEGLRSNRFNTNIDVFTMHWREHPLKDEQWYEFEKSRRTPEEVAQELDISYAKSLTGRVYPEWNEDNLRRGHFPYDHTLQLYVGWDFGATDDTAIIWAQDDGGELRIIETYKNTGKTIEWYLPFITGFMSSDPDYPYTAKEMKMIDEHREWDRGIHYGDPAGRFINQVTNTSVISEMRDRGVIVNFQDDWKHFPVRKTAARNLILNGIKLNDTENNTYFDMSMVQSSYPKVRKEGVQETDSKKPVHNWASHYRSAFEYLALGLDNHNIKFQKPYDKIKKKESSFGRVRSPVNY